jgi:type VI secretion system protein ImpE
MMSVAYDQALTAEELRADVFLGKAQVPLLVKSQDWSAQLVRSLSLLISGQVEASLEARDKAFEAAPDTPGEMDGVEFDWIADADLRFGPAIEAIIAGQWGIVPFEAIAYIKSDGPNDLRDLVWYPVQIGFRSGQSVAAFIPTRYPGTETSDRSEALLARVTEWVGGPTDENAIGQHIFNLSDGISRDLLSMRHLKFKV